MSLSSQGQMEPRVHIGELALPRSTDNSPIVTEEKVDYLHTESDDSWVDRVVGTCGSSFLKTSIFRYNKS